MYGRVSLKVQFFATIAAYLITFVRGLNILEIPLL